MSNGPEFFQTRMGMTFFEHTMPELVKQLKRIADAMGRQAGPPIGLSVEVCACPGVEFKHPRAKIVGCLYYEDKP